MRELLPFVLVGWVILSWLTHVITCLKTASWGFLIAGAVFFPVGCVHGTGIWFGVF
jgi:predicted membrane channel-forming protein YqfA (hemolysin III family)